MLAVLQDLYLCAAYFSIGWIQEIWAIWGIKVPGELKLRKTHIVFAIWTEKGGVRLCDAAG